MNSRLLEHDRIAREEGFTAGERGTATALRCPYRARTTAAWSWNSGHIEGDAKRQGYRYSRDTLAFERNGPLPGQPTSTHGGLRCMRVGTKSNVFGVMDRCPGLDPLLG